MHTTSFSSLCAAQGKAAKAARRSAARVTAQATSLRSAVHAGWGGGKNVLMLGEYRLGTC